MREVFILQGVSGSGKSTWAQARLASASERGVVCKLVSADSFFLDEQGEYRFDGRKLPQAHGRCFADFLLSLGTIADEIIVDNTNSTAVEIAPYMAAVAAENSKYEQPTVNATVMRFGLTDLDVAARRNTHGTPLVAIERQAANIIAFDKPGGNPFGWTVLPATYRA